MTTKVTKRQAEKVLASIKRQWKTYLDAGYEPPVLIMDWDWFGDGGGRPAIIWEGGPFEWALFANFGGKDEFGFDVAEADYDRDEVFVEPLTTWALGIYPPG